MELFREGAVRFYAENKQVRKSEVFYNPNRQFDRSLNVLFVRCSGKKKLKGLELFSGSGVRGLRLCTETEKFASFVFNDIKSIDTLEKNITLNGKNLRGIRLDIKSQDAKRFVSAEKYDYIDIDPFGSPAPYLNTAFTLIKKGGFIGLSATDTAALFGSAQKACMRKYGSLSLKTPYSNEIGIRILIKKVEEVANSFNFSVKPLFFDFNGNFLRLYFLVERINNGHNLGFIYQCSKCPNRSTEKSLKCGYCGSKMVKAGGLWLDPMFDKLFVRNMYRTAMHESGVDLEFNGENTMKIYRLNIVRGKNKKRISADDSITDYLKKLMKEKETVTYYTTDELASYLKTPEKSIREFEDKTVLSSKGFRWTASFESLIKSKFS